jgi:hypothetical protein
MFKKKPDFVARPKIPQNPEGIDLSKVCKRPYRIDWLNVSMYFSLALFLVVFWGGCTVGACRIIGH